jgi:uncharacterized RDD family membrane protein YckC
VAANRHQTPTGLAGAAGRAVFIPARAAARAWRRPIEEAVDEVLSAPETARLLDKAFAGPLPEELVRSLARHRVVERVVAEFAESGELSRLLSAALGSSRALELTDAVLASDAAEHAMRRVASSPEVREAISMQTAGLAEEVVGGVRGAAERLDLRAEQIVTRTPRSEPAIHAGIATRALALAVDAGVSTVLFMAAVGVSSLVASLVGSLRPAWLAGALVSSGFFILAGIYFVLFWSAAGQTPGMRLLRLRVCRAEGGSLSVGRAVLRLAGLLLAIVPLFAGFIPVLFTERRRGLPDYLAGTVVVYEGGPEVRGRGARAGTPEARRGPSTH